MPEVPLVIEIQSARGLRAAVPQLFEQTVVEPYCICEVFGRDDATAPSFRTRPRPDEDAPRWDERTQMVIEQGEHLIFMVNYKDDDSEDDVLGWAKLEFGMVMPYGFTGELSLTDTAASKVLPAFLQVSVKPLNLAQPEDLEPPALTLAAPPEAELQPPSPELWARPTENQLDVPEQLDVEMPPTLSSPASLMSPEINDQRPLEEPVPSPPVLDLVPPEPPASVASSPSSPRSPRSPRSKSGGAGKPPPPAKEEVVLPTLTPRKDLTEQQQQVVNAIDALLARKTTRPLRQSLEEALEVRKSLVEAEADHEGKLSSFGQKANDGPRSFGQVLAQAWTGNAGRSPSPTAHLLPWPSQEATHRDMPGLRSLGKPAAARMRGLLLHLERTVALDPDVSVEDLLKQEIMMEADGRIEANLEASGLGRFPPPLMVAGQEAFPLSLAQASSSDEETAAWPGRRSVKENRSKVRGCRVQVAGQARSNDAGFGAHPERRVLALQAKLEEAHGSLSAAFASMDLESRGYVSFGDFHAHLVRLHLSSVDAEGSARAMELFKLLDSDGDDLLSPRDCVKAFKGAAMMVKERAENTVGQEKLKAFLQAHGLPSDQRIPRHKPLGGDQYSRAVSLQRYLVLRYGSLYEAMEAMDVSGIGFVSQEVFVKRLLAEGYCVSEFEAEELFESFDPWGKGWLPLQRMLEYEVSGMEWLRPWDTSRSASGSRSASRAASPVRRKDFLFSEPGRLEGAPPASPRRSPSRSRSPHERLYVAGIGHKRALPGDDAIRTAYHNMEQAKSLMDDMNRKAKERSKAAMRAVEEARERAQAAKTAAATGAVPAVAPGPVERFRASRPGATMPAIDLATLAEPHAPAVVVTPTATPTLTPRAHAMTSAASKASQDSRRQQRLKAREQRRKEFMKVLDKDGDGVITAKELEDLKAQNPELSNVDLSQLDADGDGQISREELERALEQGEQSPASEAAGLLSAVANLFGASPEVVSPEKKAQHGQEEAVEKKEVPKAKALPKQLFAMARVNFMAGRKGSLAVSAAESQGSALGPSQARKRRELKKVAKAALLAVPGDG